MAADAGSCPLWVFSFLLQYWVAAHISTTGVYELQRQQIHTSEVAWAGVSERVSPFTMSCIYSGLYTLSRLHVHLRIYVSKTTTTTVWI